MAVSLKLFLVVILYLGIYSSESGAVQVPVRGSSNYVNAEHREEILSDKVPPKKPKIRVESKSNLTNLEDEDASRRGWISPISGGSGRPKPQITYVAAPAPVAPLTNTITFYNTQIVDLAEHHTQAGWGPAPGAPTITVTETSTALVISTGWSVLPIESTNWVYSTATIPHYTTITEYVQSTGWIQSTAVVPYYTTVTQYVQSTGWVQSTAVTTVTDVSNGWAINTVTATGWTTLTDRTTLTSTQTVVSVATLTDHATQIHTYVVSTTSTHYVQGTTCGWGMDPLPFVPAQPSVLPPVSATVQPGPGVGGWAGQPNVNHPSVPPSAAWYDVGGQNDPMGWLSVTTQTPPLPAPNTAIPPPPSTTGGWVGATVIPPPPVLPPGSVAPQLPVVYPEIVTSVGWGTSASTLPLPPTSPGTGNSQIVAGIPPPPLTPPAGWTGSSAPPAIVPVVEPEIVTPAGWGGAHVPTSSYVIPVYVVNDPAPIVGWGSSATPTPPLPSSSMVPGNPPDIAILPPPPTTIPSGWPAPAPTVPSSSTMPPPSPGGFFIPDVITPSPTTPGWSSPTSLPAVPEAYDVLLPPPPPSTVPAGWSSPSPSLLPPPPSTVPGGWPSTSQSSIPPPPSTDPVGWLSTSQSSIPPPPSMVPVGWPSPSQSSIPPPPSTVPGGWSNPSQSSIPPLPSTVSGGWPSTSQSLPPPPPVASPLAPAPSDPMPVLHLATSITSGWGHSGGIGINQVLSSSLAGGWLAVR